MRRIARLPKPLGLCAPCEAAQSARPTAAGPLPLQHAYSTTTRTAAAIARRPWAARQSSMPSLTRGGSRPLSVSAARPRTETTTAEEPLPVDDLAPAATPSSSSLPSSPSSAPSLAIPGAYDTAPRPENIADVAYVPAEKGDGLEMVGGIDGWFEDDQHWDQALEYRGFGPAKRVTDASTLQVLARQAVLEALAVRSGKAAHLAEAWNRGGVAARQAALSLDVDVAEDGSVRGLQGDASAVVAGLVREAAEAEEDAAAAALGAEEARELVGSFHDAWKKISLEDAALKFAITKRILQLTGHILPDALMAEASTVEALLAILVKPPKPVTLAEDQKVQSALGQLSNVAVYGRRVTPIDKHKMVGRWKVIVRELEKRQLPVTGTGGYDKSVERKWVYE